MKNRKHKHILKIVGIGDYGINVIKHFTNISNLEFVEMNTDWAFMHQTNNRFVNLGTKTTKGLGAGALVHIGEKSAEEDKIKIIDALKNSEHVIIVAGLGGGTGTGVAPIVAKISKELNIKIFAFVTMPNQIEGRFRCNNAQYGIKKLQKYVDKLFVFPIIDDVTYKLNNKTKNFFCDVYKKSDQILKQQLSEEINKLIMN